MKQRERDIERDVVRERERYSVCVGVRERERQEEKKEKRKTTEKREVGIEKENNDDQSNKEKIHQRDTNEQTSALRCED